MSWTHIPDIKKILLKKWEKGTLISNLYNGDIPFPYKLPLKYPTLKEMGERYDEVRDWIRSIEADSSPSKGRILWKEINHRELGKNTIPSALIFEEPHSLLRFLGKEKTYWCFYRLSKNLISAFPLLNAWVIKRSHILLSLEKDLERLISIVSWIEQHPLPGIYIRQLSLPGVEPKFIEKNRTILTEWLDTILPPSAIREEYRGVSYFEKRYGFLTKPEQVRFRIVDPDLSLNGLTDLSIRVDQFANLKIDCQNVFIIENDMTALAFPELKNSMVIFGKGDDLSSLKQAQWLHDKNLIYWGDLDTHGLTILSHFRSHFPQTESILMDRQTLEDHKKQWGKEPKPLTDCPPNLSKEERELFSCLSSIIPNENIGLEQEFIGFGYLMEKLIKNHY